MTVDLGGHTIREVLLGVGVSNVEVRNNILWAENGYGIYVANDSQAGPSAGLGLAFVKKVIDQHEGEISATSNASGGTKFVMVIPCPRDGGC